MEIRKILFYLLAVSFGGCLPLMSVHPLYTEKDLLFEDKLVGVWVDDVNDPNTTWEFTRPDESKPAYQLIFKDDEDKMGIFEAHLVKLDNLLFLDALPDRFPSGKKDAEEVELAYNTFFFVPVHTFIKIDFIAPLASAAEHLGAEAEVDMGELEKLSDDYDLILRLRLSKTDGLEKILEQDPNAVKHEDVEVFSVILTASTAQLQDFVTKYAEDKDLFAEETVLIRKKPKKQCWTDEQAENAEQTKQQSEPPPEDKAKANNN
jgi:hypothetical protein